MENTSRSFRKAVYAMIGAIVGAGTFALPAAMRSMGILAGSIAFWAVALLVLGTNLVFVEVVLHSRSMGRKRFPGYAEAAFGTWAKWLAYATISAQTMGVNLIYLVLGGDFLSALAKSLGLNVQTIVWQLLFWAAGAAAVFVGLKLVSRVEAWMTMAKIALILVCIAWFASEANGTLFYFASWATVMPLIGVFLFSLSGWPVIPEVAILCGKDKDKTRLAVALGTLVSALLMWLFGVFAFASLGLLLGSDPSSLSLALPLALFWLIPLVGLLVVATPFIYFSQDFKATLHLDAGLPKRAAWALTLGGPLILLFLTSRNFLSSVDFVGSIVTSFDAIFLCIVAMKLMRSDKAVSRTWRVGVPVICAAAYALVFIWKVLRF